MTTPHNQKWNNKKQSTHSIQIEENNTENHLVRTIKHSKRPEKHIEKPQC